MSASGALQPQQFGPGGKYTLRQAGSRHVEAVHTNSGRRVGAMNWFSTGIGGGTGGSSITSAAGLEVHPDKPTIYKAIVSKPHRRKGVASAMLDYARQAEPDLQHSHALSPDAVEWAKKKP